MIPDDSRRSNRHNRSLELGSISSDCIQLIPILLICIAVIHVPRCILHAAFMMKNAFGLCESISRCMQYSFNTLKKIVLHLLSGLNLDLHNTLIRSDEVTHFSIMSIPEVMSQGIPYIILN